MRDEIDEKILDAVLFERARIAHKQGETLFIAPEGCTTHYVPRPFPPVWYVAEQPTDLWLKGETDEYPSVRERRFLRSDIFWDHSRVVVYWTKEEL